MAKYKVELTRSAAKEIEQISRKSDRQRIVERISKLALDPRPVGYQKISGQEAYRVRQGVYRIIYRIEDDHLIVTIVKVGHRRDVYR